MYAPLRSERRNEMCFVIGLLAHGGKTVAHQSLVQSQHAVGVEGRTVFQKLVCLLSKVKNAAPVVLDVCGQQGGFQCFVGFHRGILLCVALGRVTFLMARVYTEHHVKGCCILAEK